MTPREQTLEDAARECEAWAEVCKKLLPQYGRWSWKRARKLSEILAYRNAAAAIRDLDSVSEDK
jgi:hypothetical protein